MERDPFETHFANLDEKDLAHQLNCFSQGKWERRKVSLAGHHEAFLAVPAVDGNTTLETPKQCGSSRELKVGIF